MDEDVEEQLAPLVDALTGAMAAVLLISIFMMLNTMSAVSDGIKQYGKDSFVENESKLGDLFGRKPPEIRLKDKKIFFFKSFKMTDEQIKTLQEYFNNNTPKKITLYSNESENISVFNLLTFLSEVGLNTKLDDIVIDMQPAKNKNISELTWE